MRVFLDASVIIAGLYSPSGGSAVILNLIEKGIITGVTSQVILGETKRNIVDKLLKITEKYEQFAKQSKIVVVPIPAKETVAKWHNIIDPKDAHVLAATIASKADYLVTLDRKHFMLEQVKKAVVFKIVTPKELIEILSL